MDTKHTVVDHGTPPPQKEDKPSPFTSWQRRVIAEKMNLDDNLRRLTEYVRTPEFDALPSEDRMLLLNQALAMQLYSNILTERIRIFARKL